MRRIVVTRFSGPLGYSLSRHFRSKDVVVDGVDLFLTAGFEQAPVGSKPYQQWLDRQSPGFMHYEVDLLQREAVMELIREIRPSAIIHSLPLPPLGSTGNNAIDCDLILGGTRNLLEAARSFCWESPFIFLTNDAIYGDCMDTVVEEKATRFDFAGASYFDGIPEDFPAEPLARSAFGAAAAEADVLVQEYGRNLGLPTCCLRGAAATDPWNPDGPLHDRLASLVQASVRGERCVISRQGIKQVREAIHASDVANFIELLLTQPRVGEVYNLGGGRANSYSILEASRLIEECTGRPVAIAVDEAVSHDDRPCYFSDLRKIQTHYPDWRVTRSLPQIIVELVKPHFLRRFD